LCWNGWGRQRWPGNLTPYDWGRWSKSLSKRCCRSALKWLAWCAVNRECRNDLVDHRGYTIEPRSNGSSIAWLCGKRCPSSGALSGEIWRSVRIRRLKSGADNLAIKNRNSWTLHLLIGVWEGGESRVGWNRICIAHNRPQRGSITVCLIVVSTRKSRWRNAKIGIWSLEISQESVGCWKWRTRWRRVCLWVVVLCLREGRLKNRSWINRTKCTSGIDLCQKWNISNNGNRAVIVVVVVVCRQKWVPRICWSYLIRLKSWICVWTGLKSWVWIWIGLISRVCVWTRLKSWVWTRLKPWIRAWLKSSRIVVWIWLRCLKAIVKTWALLLRLKSRAWLWGLKSCIQVSALRDLESCTWWLISWTWRLISWTRWLITWIWCLISWTRTRFPTICFWNFRTCYIWL